MDERASRPAAALMLGGGLRPSPLGYAVGGSVLDLEIMPGVTVAQRWLDMWTSLPIEHRPTVVRCLVARSAPVPRSIEARDGVSVELDAREYCGPAGAVRDAVAAMLDADHVIVHEAATFPAASPEGCIADHLASGAEGTIAVNPDGSPAGLYAFRARAFRTVSSVGFTDLKEQFLDRLRAGGAVLRVHRMEGAGILPLRTRTDFLRAAKLAAGEALSGVPSIEPAYIAAGGSGRKGSFVAPGATIGIRTGVIDSVIMNGSLVDQDAIVVRSIVCPGARVGPGVRVVDAVVGPDGVRSDAWANAKVRWRQDA